MGMFTKTDRDPSDPKRRLQDVPLDGGQARTLPLVWRIGIHVLVSEMRKMMDEREDERDMRAQIQQAGREGYEAGLRYRDRTEQDG